MSPLSITWRRSWLFCRNKCSRPLSLYVYTGFNVSIRQHTKMSGVKVVGFLVVLLAAIMVSYLFYMYMGLLLEYIALYVRQVILYAFIEGVL